jgi:hypothetical protein
VVDNTKNLKNQIKQIIISYKVKLMNH